MGEELLGGTEMTQKQKAASPKLIPAWMTVTWSTLHSLRAAQKRSPFPGASLNCSSSSALPGSWAGLLASWLL